MADQNTSLIQKTIRFLQTDIWRIRANQLSRQKFFLIRQLRVMLLAFRGFNEDKCQLRASALTFYSLLSIVPVVAMAFGVAKGFGFEKRLETQLYMRLPGQEEVVARIIEFAHAFLENTRGGLIAGIGIVILFWTVIKVLGNIERSFNDIWGIKKSRSMSRKFSDYLSIMLICPILLIMSSSITVLITSQVRIILDKLTFLGSVAPLIMSLLSFLPYVMLWILFTFMYIFMPNEKVRFKSALIGGVIAGTLYQIVQWAYITFQVGVSKFGAIYGSFAALPLFLFWLQISWLIVLLGAEISFAEQNVETYEFEQDCLKSSTAFKRQIALSMVLVCVRRFCKEQPPPTTDELACYLEIPIRLVRQVLFELTEAKVLVEVKMNGSHVTGYQPAHDVDRLSIKDVIDALDNRGIDSIPIGSVQEITVIQERLSQIHRTMDGSTENVLLKAL